MCLITLSYKIKSSEQCYYKKPIFSELGYSKKLIFSELSIMVSIFLMDCKQDS